MVGNVFVIFFSKKKATIVNGYQYHKALILSSKSLYIIGLLMTILELDTIILNYYFGLEKTGVYSIVKKISLLTSMPLVAINSVITPQLSILFEQKRISEINLLLKKVFVLLLLYSIPVTTLIILFSSELLVIFGQEFKQGNNILIITTIGQFINIITGPVGNILIMSNQEKLLRNIIVVITSLCLVSYFIFIPLYGVTGAALITSLRVILQNLIVFGLVLKQSKKYGK